MILFVQSKITEAESRSLREGEGMGITALRSLGFDVGVMKMF
jgi:hypothetical protein